MNNKTIKTMLLVLTVSLTGNSYVAAHPQHASEDSSMGMSIGNMDRDEMGMGQMGMRERGDDHMGMGHMGNRQIGMQQMGMGQMGMGYGSMNLSQLNLTDQQKKEIQAVTATAMNQNMGDMQVHHAEMQALLSNDVFDENKAKTLIADHQSEMGENMLAMLKVKYQILQLLDDQQKEQLMEMQNNRMNTK